VSDGVRDMNSLIDWLARRQMPGNVSDDEDTDESVSETTDAVEFPRSGVGFNGRCNKLVDSCYSWWICGTLKVSAKLACYESNLLNRNRL
jgi:geranylgeranyl transferase type-1 subunit beta